MARPEGETTRLLRATMDLDLDAVNAKLVTAGEEKLDAVQFTKRRAYIRAKDSGGKSRKSAVGKKKLIKATAKATAKKTKTPKVKRGGRGPSDTPRENTFAAHVWEEPYDVEPAEIMRRAKAKGIKGGHISQVYKVRAKYPPKEAPKALTKLNDIASSAELREQAAAAASNRLHHGVKAIAASADDTASARSQLVILALRLGKDQFEEFTREYYLAHERIEAAILGKTT